MKARVIVAVLFAATLAAAASTASGKVVTQSATTLTVWLQDDAKNGWPDAVAAATRAFEAKHPGVNVVERGNTETTKYMAAGAFQRLQAKSFPNSGKWLAALKGSCTYSGKLLCVPYYAGARAVIYRKDYYRQAGIKGTPRTLDASQCSPRPSIVALA